MSNRLRLRTGPGLSGHEAVGRDDSGRVVFVSGAAPDEEVLVEVVDEHPKWARARTLDVLQPSPHRVEPRCPHHDECGGCGLQHVAPERQAQAKAEQARQVLRRIGGAHAGRGAVEPGEWAPTWRGPAYGVRSRARWRAAPGAFGQFARQGHRVVDLTCCPILEPPLEKALLALRAKWHSQSDASGLDVQALTDGQEVWWSDGGGAHPDFEVGHGHRVPVGAPVDIPDAFGTRVVAVGAFGQNHRAGNDAMLQQLQAWLPATPVILELYAGSGNWTRLLQDRAERVVAVEGDRRATQHLPRCAPQAEVWTTSAEKGLARFLRRPPERWGMLVNPPRPGLSKPLRRSLSANGLEWLIYISCNPASFARDAGQLAQLGLRIDQLRIFDLYPQTGHVELMARFVPE